MKEPLPHTQSGWGARRGDSPGAHWFAISLVLLTLVGAGLRFYGLGFRDFWFDESCTFRYVYQLFDWPNDSNLLVESTNLPYYIALRGWVALFGYAEASFRAMSALAASLTVPLLGLLACRIAGRTAGVVCALLAAFHPLHIHYAHEARAYALWILCLTGTMYLLVVAAQRRRALDWLWYGLCMLLCLHLHYFSIYLIPMTVACVWLTEDRRRILVLWTVTTALVLLGFAPYFVAAVWPASRQGGGAWIAPYWDPATAMLRTLWAFMPAGGYPEHLRGLSIASPDTVVLGPAWLTALSRTVPTILMAGVIAIVLRDVRTRLRLRVPAGTAGAAERDPSVPHPRIGWGTRHLFLAFVTLGPLVLAYLYSLLVRPVYLVGRYDLIAWPGFMIWVAMAVATAAEGGGRKRRPILIGAACLLMVACSMVPIARMAALRPPPTFHNARAQRLAELCGAGDLVIAFSYDRDYLSYYLYRAGFAGSIVSFPSWLDRYVGWVDTEADLAPQRQEGLAEDARHRIQLVRKVLESGSRVFVLFDYVAGLGDKGRHEIMDVFKNAVKRTGLYSQPVDEELMILELTAPQSPSASVR